MTHDSTTARRGLTESEARARLAAEGFNELPAANQRTFLRIVIEVLREPMLALLLTGGVIYLILGDLTEALVLLAFATFSVVITVVQETRTERVLEALRDLSSPRALVIRDGVRKRIPGREVARGDLVVVVEGDRVPADAVLLRAHDVQTDESLLTGESVPVRKIAAAAGHTPQQARPGGDDLPFVYSGSLVVRGEGLAEVRATGPRTEIGKIGQSLRELETAPANFQVQTRRFVRVAALVGVSLSLLATLIYGLTRGGWLDAVLAGIALGMSMLPEEFPVVLAVFMAMGAWRISKARVLTRRASAIETLGSATVLCTDKTGTLTENRMTIRALRLPAGEAMALDGENELDMPENFRALVAYGKLASATEPFDPMEKAFHALSAAQRSQLNHDDWTRVREYGLRPELLAMSHVWQKADGDENMVVAAKGAPEAIADLCRLGDAEREALLAALHDMASQGLRVLGVARAAIAPHALPQTQREFGFEFLGLVGLADPLRPGVREAVAECRAAGIKIVMITGDFPATAKAIAAQAGFDVAQIVTGEAVAAMSEDELSACVREATVFARIMPDQKLRIVNALKRNGEIVAMTGDGVNDAPSLKAAHIGVAMGGRGTDVAREASAIVLLDDDFTSIVAAVRLGRRIYDNLRKAMAFIIAVHVPVAGLALLPLVFGLPIMLWPMHIAFLEMVIDPVCSLVFEAEREERDVMRRKPRDPAEPLFPGWLVLWSALQGALALVLVAAIYVVALNQGMPEDEVRALSFFSLVLSIVALIFVNRSFSASLASALGRPNTALGAVLAVVALALGATLLWPWASKLFHFGPLHLDDLLLTLAAGVAVLIALEGIKAVALRRPPNSAQ